MTHVLAASPCNIIHISEIQATILDMTSKSWNQRHSKKTLPKRHKAGPDNSAITRSQFQTSSGPVYPLTVWQVRGANVYFEPKRVLKTPFHSSTGKQMAANTKFRSHRMILVNVRAPLTDERFPDRLPELPRNSFHRNPRPLGRTYFSTDKPARDHPLLLTYGPANRLRGSMQSTGRPLPFTLPDLPVKRIYSNVTEKSNKT